MFEGINIFDALEEPTQLRSESIEAEEVEDFSSALEFEEDHPIEDIPSHEPVEEPYTEADALANAEMLVDLIDTVNVASMTPLARWKLKKKRGGNDAIRKMQALKEKQFAQAELTEQEKRLIYQYDSYLKDKEEMESSIPYTADEKKKLVHSASIYLKNKKIRISGDLSFWGELAMIQGSRLMAILTA